MFKPLLYHWSVTRAQGPARVLKRLKSLAFNHDVETSGVSVENMYPRAITCRKTLVVLRYDGIEEELVSASAHEHYGVKAPTPD